jgi:hypothetical protein
MAPTNVEGAGLGTVEVAATYLRWPLRREGRSESWEGGAGAFSDGQVTCNADVSSDRGDYGQTL